MELVFISNFLNHHQKLFADTLCNTDGIEFTFIETIPMYDWLKRGGYTDYSNESYVLRSWESKKSKQRAYKLAKSADVLIFAGPESLSYAIMRAKCTDKLTFDVSERWLKKGFFNIFSPRLLRYLWYYNRYFRHKQFYKLCSSAFASGDQYKLGTYRNRCFKWGYFTKVDDLIVQDRCDRKTGDNIIRIMWCARFLNWKHPELPVKLAYRLKQKGYSFIIDMFGSGKELDSIKSLITRMAVEDVVSLCGNRPNDEILSEMREHDIFLFTSDKNEGWGAVLNEAMSNGCAVVGSDEIGSVPFLIEDGVNGCVFESRDLDSLEDKVIYLIEHPKKRVEMAQNAYHTLRNVWSPQNAAKQLLNLINAIQSGDESMIPEDGPCSRA